MPRLTDEEKLEKLKERRDKVLSDMRSLAGRKGAQSRKDDTRAKILLGAAFLETAGTNPSFMKAAQSFIASFEGRDRELFSRWNLQEKAQQAAARATARRKARAAAGQAPSQPAPAKGAFEGKALSASAPSAKPKQAI